ncbi:MAG: hypothetical protein ACRDO2_14815 [Nocardioidaceae bacterium]
MTAALILADYDPNDIRPGWIALGVVVALAVATFLLWRSMNSQLRRIDVPTKKELAEQERGDADQEAAADGSAPQDSERSNGAKP